MTSEEIIEGYRKIIDDQSAMLKSAFEIIDGYEQQLKSPRPTIAQDLLGNTEIWIEHFKNNPGKPLELDSLKLSDEERRKRFGSRIRMLRKALGLTQEQLAEKINATKPSIAAYETGRREAGYRNLIGLSRALNTTTDWLLGEPPPIK